MKDQHTITNILLVEDDEDFSAAIVSRLKKKGYGVFATVSAEEALKRLSGEDLPIDVVIADIKLPGMDGTRFLKEVREINRDLPVIMLTGYASLESAKEAVKLNASDYLLKPLNNIEELLGPIDKAARSYRLFQKNRELVADLRRNMRELEVSEKKYRNLFETAGDMIVTVDYNGKITSANRAAEDTAGYERDGLTGKILTEIIVPIGKKKAKKLRQILKEPLADVLEVKILTKKGAERIGEMSVTPMWEGVKIAGIQCIVRDMTNRHKVEKALRASEEKYRLITENTSDFIAVIDCQGRFIYASPSYSLFGYESGKLEGEIIFDMMHPEDKAVLHSMMRRYSRELAVRRTGPRSPEAFRRVEYRFRDKQGDWRFLEATVNHTRILAEKGFDVLVVSRDIGERKQVEKIQRLAQLGELSADMAHEVNNPLQIISGRAQISLMDGAAGEEVKENLKLIVDQCERSKHIIHRLLMMSKPSKGEKKEININESLDMVVKMLEYQMSLLNVHIEKYYDHTISTTRADEKQLQEVFLNILRNAVDAMPEGGTITIVTKKEDDRICVEIVDTGTGISEEDLSRIFIPFFTTKEKGTGLGLPVCYGIIKAHGGDLKYKSKRGEGTTATVLLPTGM